jgi:hypothetical protein
MNIDPERKKQTQRLCACGDKRDHFCGKVYPEADLNERQTRRIMWWCLGAFAATVAGLLSLQGCR